jgi:hypothetical protein
LATQAHHLLSCFDRPTGHPQARPDRRASATAEPRAAIMVAYNETMPLCARDDVPSAPRRRFDGDQSSGLTWLALSLHGVDRVPVVKSSTGRPEARVSDIFADFLLDLGESAASSQCNEPAPMKWPPEGQGSATSKAASAREPTSTDSCRPQTPRQNAPAA